MWYVCGVCVLWCIVCACMCMCGVYGVCFMCGVWYVWCVYVVCACGVVCV